MKDRSAANNKHVSDTHAFVRGKDYYGGEKCGTKINRNV